MELLNNERINNSEIQLSCNWRITNNKQLHDAFTAITLTEPLEKTNVEDMVFLNTCISVEPTQSNNEPCMLTIKLTTRQRISRIAIVSEAYVLEFFKEFGEYETTVFAELVDEFEDNSVYIAETAIVPSTTEASVKFTKTKNGNSIMWIYGIRLYLTEPRNVESKSSPMDAFKSELINNFFPKMNCNDGESSPYSDIQSYTNMMNFFRTKTERSDEKETAQSASTNTMSNAVDIKAYIDNKFHDMEIGVMKRIDEMEQKTNEKLDIILKQLETQFIIK